MTALVEESQSYTPYDIVSVTGICVKELKERKLKMGDVSVRFITSQGYRGVRLWFVCPLCHERKGVIHRHPMNWRVGCRKCIELDYRKHRFKGMLEYR